MITRSAAKKARSAQPPSEVAAQPSSPNKKAKASEPPEWFVKPNPKGFKGRAPQGKGEEFFYQTAYGTNAHSSRWFITLYNANAC